MRGLDKWREELNVDILYGPILEVLLDMGFRPAVRYRKDSRIFDYDDVTVSVDRLGPLGAFCEIEAADLGHDLNAVASDLGLDPDQYEPREHPMMVSEAAKARE